MPSFLHCWFAMRQHLPLVRLYSVWLSILPNLFTSKLFCVVISNNVCQFEIYSSETASWWPYTGSFHSDLLSYDVVFDGGIYWNGSIHWITDRYHELLHISMLMKSA
ncbi:hypothetical protein FEM48_Zijuj03G0132700 [Ziziphus jujuba var. spinosa]|uniref:Uncharacterized protein n=1 Tax=Ziziphus jujuba var. spinosa TaxID=714518 RepID=A0A978VQI5_ZIZJJ|nr:hypothetical protein FEM48_Zijuj03G0132700 [Ziziphus jujuba var. spinosa]